jgi:hypothetical protein
MAPLPAFTERPGGNPLETAQVYPAQLEQVMVAEYATLTFPLGRDDVVMVGGDCASAIEEKTTKGRNVRSSLIAGLPSQKALEAR